MDKERVLNDLAQFNERESKLSSWTPKTPSGVSGMIHQLNYLKANCLLNLHPEENIDQVKKMYFRAARASQLAWWYNMNLLVDYGYEVSLTRNSTSPHIFMDYPKFLLCGSTELSKVHFAHVLNVFSDKRKNDGVAIIYAFLYLMNGRMDEAKEKVTGLEMKMEAGIKPFAYMVKGILLNEPKICNDALLMSYKIERKYSGDIYDYHPTTTALAKLALNFGVDIDTSHPTINKRMLEDEKPDYTDIDEYFGQLGIEPLNRVKLSNY